MYSFFDGHNDLLLNLWLNYPDAPEQFFTGIEHGHLDFPRIQQAGLVGGLFAIFVPPHRYIVDTYPAQARQLDDPLQVMWQQFELLRQLIALSAGKMKLCTSAAELRQCQRDSVFAVVAHIEGADALDSEGVALEAFYQAGVRSVGPFWNLPNAFGEGVNGSFPGSPDTGPGLTSAGKHFILGLQQKRMMIDVSHMNEQAFWQTAELTTQPLIASHSSVHALCQQPRNLTDKQLLAIRNSGGIVGINFGNAFIRPDGQRQTATPLEQLVDHFLYVLDLIGDEHLGLGSDFDGVSVPEELGDVSGLPSLLQHLKQRGVPESSLQKIAYKNWFSALERTWGQ